jgi:hypothetical protein
VLGIVCIALVLMSGMVQAVHFHAAGGPDHDCALCATAHNVAQVAPPVTLKLINLPVRAVTVPRSLSRPRRAVFFRLSSRPPPLTSALLA